MSAYCCKMMQADLERVCDQHSDRSDCPDCLIVFRPPSNSYGLMIHDGGSSTITISFCPWCGVKLPECEDD